MRETTIGFEAVKALLAGRVAGATAFWNVEGVALRRSGPDMREFRVDDYGAPSYPELVLTVTRETLEDHPSLVRATIRGAPARLHADPERPGERGLDDARAASRASSAPRSQPSSTRSRPAFTAGAAEFGQLRPARLRQWAAWDARFGILKAPIDVSRAFDTTLVKRPPTP